VSASASPRVRGAQICLVVKRAPKRDLLSPQGVLSLYLLHQNPGWAFLLHRHDQEKWGAPPPSVSWRAAWARRAVFVAQICSRTAPNPIVCRRSQEVASPPRKEWFCVLGGGPCCVYFRRFAVEKNLFPLVERSDFLEGLTLLAQYSSFLKTDERGAPPSNG